MLAPSAGVAVRSSMKHQIWMWFFYDLESLNSTEELFMITSDLMITCFICKFNFGQTIVWPEYSVEQRISRYFVRLAQTLLAPTSLLLFGCLKKLCIKF